MAKMLVVLTAFVLPLVDVSPGGARASQAIPTLDLGAATRTTMVEMREVWRIDADDERVLLGMVTDAFLATDGSICLLDSQLQNVVRVGPSGEDAVILCRAGEGPGELSNVYDIEPLGGGSLGLISVVPPAIAVVDAFGVLTRTIRFELAPATDGVGQYFSVVRIRPCGDRFIGDGEQTLVIGSSLVRRRFLAGFDSQGRESARFDEHDRPVETGEVIRLSERAMSFPPGDAWDVDVRHRIFSATDRDQYAIQMRDSDGSPVALLKRPFDRHKQTEAEREEAKSNFSVASTGGQLQVEIEVDDFAPVILGLRCVEDRLWVINSDWMSDIGDHGASCFDVIDPDAGTWEVRCLSMPIDPRADMIIPLDSRRVLRIRNLLGAFAGATAGSGTVIGEGSSRVAGGNEEGFAVILYEAVD